MLTWCQLCYQDGSAGDEWGRARESGRRRERQKDLGKIFADRVTDIRCSVCVVERKHHLSSVSKANVSVTYVTVSVTYSIFVQCTFILVQAFVVPLD